MTGFDKANEDDNDDDEDDDLDDLDDEDDDGLDAAKMVAIRAASEAFRSMRSNTRCRVGGSRLDRKLCVIHPRNAHRLQVVVLLQRRNALLRSPAKNARRALRQVRFRHVGIWLAEEQGRLAVRAKEFHAVKQLVFAVEVPRGAHGARREGKPRGNLRQPREEGRNSLLKVKTDRFLEWKKSRLFWICWFGWKPSETIYVESGKWGNDRVAGGDRGSLLGGSFAAVFDAGDFAHENRGDFV